MKKYLSILVFLSVAYYSIVAQAPQQVNYQAVVRDAAGNPLPLGTQVSVKFQIHDQTPAGNVIYQESTAATTNQFGLITYGLGSLGSLSQVNWGSGAKYLQVLIDPSGGSNYTDMGTTQLLSVPYALYAANSGGSSGSTGATGASGNTGSQGPRGVAGPTGSTGATGPAGTNGINGINGANGATGATGTTGVTGPNGTSGTNGTNGVTGATGPTGPAGANGTNGTNGVNGVTGVTGAPGAAGTNGINGINGTTGASGATGANGTNGTNGVTGATGATGATGPAGANGSNGTNGTNGVGVTGATGATGPAGSNGVTGATGATGATGTAGTNGTNGATGAAGATGPAGTNGTNGTNGINGATGPTGSTGATGPTGTNGTNGTDGTNGATGATGTAGTNGTNGATGAAGATGPAGANGTNGTNGINGATGPTGSTGATGPTGTNGTNGTDGTNGPTGATGATGTNGTNGLNGATGVTGASGTNGTNGATGATGITGITGTNGTNGATGVTGSTGATGTNGITGATGAAGTTGTNGTNGATGATGPTGTNGTNGATGATGLQGPTGAGGLSGTLNYVVKFTPDGTSGGNSVIYDNGTAVGIGTIIPSATLDINGNGLLATGSGPIPATGAGTRMMWYPGQAAFRAGGAASTEWDDVNTGQYSTAFGLATTASGKYSTAMGNQATASGDYSLAVGRSDTASGQASTAMGAGTSASGYFSTAMGTSTIASGRASTAIGSNTVALGDYSTAMGNSTQALSFDETSMGEYNTTYSPFSSTSWNSSDRLFGIGNGTSGSPNDALVILKNGSIGLGTATPVSFVEIRQDSPGNAGPNLSISNYAAGTGNGGTIDFLTFPLFSPGEQPSARIAVADDGNYSGSLLFYTNTPYNYGIGLTERMRVADNGNVGIGTSSPGSLLTVNGNTQTNNLQMTSGASSGYLLQSDANGNASWVSPSTAGYWTRNNTYLYNNSGTNVGIGTSSPGSLLTVNGNIQTKNLQMTTGASSGYLLQSDANGNASWVSPSAAGYWTLNNTYLYNNSGTNVGIGTSAPSSLLEIRKDAAGTIAPVFSIYNASSGSGYGGAIDFYTYNTSGQAASARIAAADDGNYSGNILFLTKVQGSNTGALTERVRITDAGSLGIGTIAPTNSLSVNAGMNIDQAAANNGSLANNTSTGNGITFGSAAGEGIASNRANSTAGSNQYGLDLYTDFTKRMSITNGGSVGIGTTSPASLFTVSGSDNSTNGKGAAVQISNTASGGANWYLRAGATGTGTPAGGLSIANDGAYVMDIDNTGNVGIGTSTPSTLLHVNGKLTISDGTQGNGKILMSDANGMASWTSNTKALNPSFKVQGNAAQSVGYQEEIQLNFTQISWDDAGTMSLNNGYTVPISGTYHFDVRVTWGLEMGTKAALTYIDCFVNGHSVDFQYTNFPINGSYSGETSTYSGQVQLTAGDLVTFEIYQENSVFNGQSIDNANSSETSWSGYKVN